LASAVNRQVRARKKHRRNKNPKLKDDSDVTRDGVTRPVPWRWPGNDWNWSDHVDFRLPGVSV